MAPILRPTIRTRQLPSHDAPMGPGSTGDPAKRLFPEAAIPFIQLEDDMAISRKLILAAALSSAALLSACAAGPYYDDYGYNGYSPYGYGYSYDPYYYGPSVGLGFGYSTYDRDYRWRDRDGRWHDRADRDRDEWRRNSPSTRANDA